MQRRRMPATAAASADLRWPSAVDNTALPGHAGAMPAGGTRLLRRPKHASAAVLPSASDQLPSLLQRVCFFFSASATDPGRRRCLLRDRTVSLALGCGVTVNTETSSKIKRRWGLAMKKNCARRKSASCRAVFLLSL